MTAATHAKIPQHLHKYIVEQDYSRYTPEDQAVWRFIMRQLKSYLGQHAHPIYLEGLRKTGIDVEKIPLIDDVDSHLEVFGWGAVPVSGFIPPAAFMEFQSIGVLPIASDMRTLDHLLYTPAPDIVHEAAGHAPILVDPDYASYLRQYGEVARHSIISKEDVAQYEAIRILSDMKEDPHSTPEEIAKADKVLAKVNAAITQVSEAGLLSRMNWWTAEYGLIGPLNSPKIFGAGLLSSVGESRTALGSSVVKIPLSVECVNYSYDITEKQPQLFVTKDFATLGEVLEQLAGTMAYRRGGRFGLDRAIQAGTVNTVQLNSGIQIAGILQKYTAEGPRGEPIYMNFSGPCQLAFGKAELEGQGTHQHPMGFSTPLGFLKNDSRCPSTFNNSDLERLGLRHGRKSVWEFASGVRVEGVPTGWEFVDGKLILISWRDCRVTLGDQLLFDPAWGAYDMAIGSTVTSVFGGPADRSYFGRTEDFVAKRVPKKRFSSAQIKRHTQFQRLRDLRQAKNGPQASDQLRRISNEYLSSAERDWLQGIELLELSYELKVEGDLRNQLLSSLNDPQFDAHSVRECVNQGVTLAQEKL